MTAVNGRLDSAQLIRRLQSGARPFPKSSDASIPDCHVPAGGGDLQTGECNCTTDTCGAGMANAHGAVTEALRPVAVATADSATAVAGQTVSLGGSGSFASNGRSIASYAWTVVSSNGQPPLIVNAGTPSASVTTTDSGWLTLRLTVIDDQGAQDAIDVTVNAVTVTVSPGAASVNADGATQEFSATVANASNTAVTWQVNGVTGGNSTVGTISASGLYTAPAIVPSPSTVSVRAISAADNTRAGAAQVTITQAPINNGGGGGGGAIAAAWLLACLLALVSRCVMRASGAAGSIGQAASR
jgi:serine protease